MIARIVSQCRHSILPSVMQELCVYQGHGMYDKDTAILLRSLKQHACPSTYIVNVITPDEIKCGRLKNNVSLLAIGGGFDLGLIKALGNDGMKEVRSFVTLGGHYLGICSGAYFATDYIEFDNGGPLQVCGERFLKFYPGCGIGPLYKTYDYRCRIGAVAASISFTPKGGPLKVFFNGGGCFLGIDMKEYLEKRKEKEVCLSEDFTDTKNRSIQNGKECKRIDWLQDSIAKEIANQVNETFNGEEENQFNGRVDILSRYQDLPNKPVAMVKCNIGKGTAILSGVHFEYEAADIDDDDRTAEHIIPDLAESADDRKALFRSVLSLLDIVCI